MSWSLSASIMPPFSCSFILCLGDRLPRLLKQKNGEMLFNLFFLKYFLFNLSQAGEYIHTQINVWLKTVLTFSWIPWRWRPPGHLGPGSYRSVSVLYDKCDSGPLHLWGHSSSHPLQGSHSGPSSWHVDVSCFDDAQSLTCAAMLPGSEEKTTLLDNILKICTEWTNSRWVRTKESRMTICHANTLRTVSNKLQELQQH